MRISSRALGLGLLALAVLATGCGNAKIGTMVPGGNPGSGQLECWVVIEFTSDPGGIDRKDVVVEFDSPALAGPQSYDWSFIAAHDVISQGEFQGYRKNTDTTPDVDPPLGVPIRVKYPLDAMDSFVLEPGQSLDLTATLYWGGKKQDSASRTIGHVYREAGSPL